MSKSGMCRWFGVQVSSFTRLCRFFGMFVALSVGALTRVRLLSVRALRCVVRGLTIVLLSVVFVRMLVCNR
jgi:hypothetical protein